MLVVCGALQPCIVRCTARRLELEAIACLENSPASMPSAAQPPTPSATATAPKPERETKKASSPCWSGFSAPAGGSAWVNHNNAVPSPQHSTGPSRMPARAQACNAAHLGAQLSDPARCLCLIRAHRFKACPSYTGTSHAHPHLHPHMHLPVPAAQGRTRVRQADAGGQHAHALLSCL